MKEQLNSTLSMRFLSTQIDLLDSLGYARKLSLNFLNLTNDKFDEGNIRIDLNEVEELYREASKVLNDPFIGLRAGHSFRVSNYGKTGSIYTFCRDLKHVIQMNAKYQRIAIDAGEIAYENKGWTDMSGHFLSLVPYNENQNCRHVLNMVVAAYATTFNWLSWGLGTEIISISFRQDEPSDVSLFEEIYDCPVFFGHDKIGIEFSDEAIQAPLTTQNDEKLAMYVATLDSFLNIQNNNISLETSVRESIRSALSLGYVSLPIIASRMNMSERQLRQNLQAADLRYRALLEAERQKIFSELHERGKSFAVISQELCYNDQAAFNRAFKRWYDMTPGQYIAATSSSILSQS